MTPAGTPFWDMVIVGGADECWEWQAAKSSGYGTVGRGIGRTTTKAHRVAWEMTNGAVTDGLHVLHRCDTPSCCNPSHLFLGTHADNMRDKVLKGRHGMLNGEAHPCAKLTEDDVREIRLFYSMGAKKKHLSSSFKVTHQSIHAIVIRKTWRHVD